METEKKLAIVKWIVGNVTISLIKEDQNTGGGGGGALFEFFMRTAMHGRNLVSSAISVCHN